MAARRKSASRPGGSGGGSALLWFVAGLVLGLGLAILAFNRGLIPQPGEREQAAQGASAKDGSALLEESSGAEDVGSRYDFFTVLPEMEVVVPEQELSTQAAPQAAAPPNGAGERFILQAGSFRNAQDADQRKAELALLGAVANVQKITVDTQTWHRVRVGPLPSAREADQLRRRLQENGIEVMVLKESG